MCVDGLRVAVDVSYLYLFISSFCLLLLGGEDEEEYTVYFFNFMYFTCDFTFHGHHVFDVYEWTPKIFLGLNTVLAVQFFSTVVISIHTHIDRPYFKNTRASAISGVWRV